MKNHDCSRRSFIKLTGWTVLLASMSPRRLLSATVQERTLNSSNTFLVEGTASNDSVPVDQLVAEVFKLAGGIKRFISQGNIVAIKPNISWAQRPEYAATTNPQVLKALIELCFDAGAKKVRIADYTINDPNRCFSITGAAAVAKVTGAELVHPRSSLIKEMKIGGERVTSWPVFTPLVEADTVINIPVAKHHSLTTLTIGMKNWIGAIGGSRWVLHQDIHQSIVDLARFFNPAFTLVDATRILTSNGPSGGNLAFVSHKNTLILSNDQVAADARAAQLFGKYPEDIEHIRLGEKQGLGTQSLPVDRVRVVTL